MRRVAVWSWPLHAVKALLVQCLSGSIVGENNFPRLNRVAMSEQKPKTTETEIPEHEYPDAAEKAQIDKETGGPQGLEPTRYGDWESKGRCVDF